MINTKEQKILQFFRPATKHNFWKSISEISQGSNLSEEEVVSIINTSNCFFQSQNYRPGIIVLPKRISENISHSEKKFLVLLTIVYHEDFHRTSRFGQYRGDCNSIVSVPGVAKLRKKFKA